MKNSQTVIERAGHKLTFSYDKSLAAHNTVPLNMRAFEIQKNNYYHSHIITNGFDLTEKIKTLKGRQNE